MKRSVARTTVAVERPATLSTFAVVVCSVVEFVVLALLTLITIHAAVRLYEAGRWVGQSEAVQIDADQVVRRLRSADEAVLADLVSSRTGAGQQGLALDRISPPLDLEQQLRLDAKPMPWLAAPVEQLCTAVEARFATVRLAFDLGQQDKREQGVAVLAAIGGPESRNSVENALRDVTELTRARRDGWNTKEMSASQETFWIALAAGAVGLLVVLAVALRNMLGLEAYETLRTTLARTQSLLGRSERARNEFIQVVGHDLRQPLQAIGLFAMGLERRLPDKSAKPLLDGLRSSAASMNRMLAGLIDISKLDAGAVTIEPAIVRLDAVLGPIKAEFDQLAESKDLDLVIPPSQLVVNTDPVMLESILRNLVSNGLRYTHDGKVEVTCEIDGDEVIISVADTGVGISTANQENIFRDFFRVQDRERSGEGLGLGLGIVRRLAGLLDIRLEMTSVVDQGTVFSIAVPRALSNAPVLANNLQALHARKEGQIAPEQLLAGKHVLIVDDDEAICRALRGELEVRGMLVTVVSSPAAACMLFQEGPATPFDIILMDRDLRSTMTGTELLDHLAARFGVMLPAMIMSGTMDFRVIRELQESGYPWLAKPVPLTALLREMHRLTDREQMISAA